MEDLEEQYEEYDDIPVHYCTKCLSLRIMAYEGSPDFCDECGCTETATTEIETWEEMYKEKYNKEF